MNATKFIFVASVDTGGDRLEVRFEPFEISDEEENVLIQLDIYDCLFPPNISEISTPEIVTKIGIALGKMAGWPLTIQDGLNAEDPSSLGKNIKELGLFLKVQMTLGKLLYNALKYPSAILERTAPEKEETHRISKGEAVIFIAGEPGADDCIVFDESTLREHAAAHPDRFRYDEERKALIEFNITVPDEQEDKTQESCSFSMIPTDKQLSEELLKTHAFCSVPVTIDPGEFLENFAQLHPSTCYYDVMEKTLVIKNHVTMSLIDKTAFDQFIRFDGADFEYDDVGGLWTYWINENIIFSSVREEVGPLRIVYKPIYEIDKESVVLGTGFDEQASVKPNDILKKVALDFPKIADWDEDAKALVTYWHRLEEFDRESYEKLQNIHDFMVNKSETTAGTPCFSYFIDDSKWEHRTIKLREGV